MATHNKTCEELNDWRYVKVDLDRPTLYEVTRAWHMLGKDAAEIVGRVSSGQNGVHLRALLRCTPEEERLYRAMVGDDTLRLHWDEEHDEKPTSILFNTKFGGEATEWFQTLDLLLIRYEGCREKQGSERR